jgi:plastocyanin
MTARPDRRRVLAGLAGLAALPLLAARAAAHGGVVCGTIHEVEIKGFAFVPDTIEVAEGDGIRWTNRDLAPHTATAVDDTWDTGPIAEGESVTLEVVKGMTGSYHCQFHPHMAATVTILAA